MFFKHRSVYMINALFFFFFLLLSSSQVFSQATMDSPHNLLNEGCIHCHDFTAWSQPNMIPDLAAGTTEDEYESLCIVCHTGSGLPGEGSFMTGHSNVTTSSKYHNGNWSVGCSVCHNQHLQPVNKVVGNNGGFIRNKIDLRRIVIEGSDNVKTGLKTIKLLATTGHNSFADGDTTIDGICEVCHTQTNHWRNDGSLAGQGAHIGLKGSNCTNCHPHNQGFGGVAGCAGCHDFPPGQLVSIPAPTGSATAGVHTSHTSRYYPCQYCHMDSVGNGPTHNNGDNTITLGFSLFNGAYQGGNYDGQLLANYNTTTTTPATTVTKTGSKICSNLYCHGVLPDSTNWGGGTNTTPVWDGSVLCGDCHRATASPAPTKGSHVIHAQAWSSWGTRGNQYPCDFCHSDPVSDDSLHANNKSEVIFSNNPMTAGGVYNGNDDMLGTYGTCDTTYCHSTAQSSPPGDAPEYRTTAQWGTVTGGCANCHYYSDSTPLLSTGSHLRHWFSEDNTNCYTCHNYDFVDDTCFACHENGDPSKSHANGNIDVVFLPMLGDSSYSGTGPPNDAYGSCSNTYCHSDGKSGANPALFSKFPIVSAPIRWDGQTPDPQDDAFSCNNCHQYPPVNDSHEVHVTTRGYVCSNCHSVTTQDNITINSWGSFLGAPGHVNTLFDLNPSGQFVDPISVSHDISFVYSPMIVDGNNDGGQCSSNTCHIEWGITDPIRWKYTP